MHDDDQIADSICDSCYQTYLDNDPDGTYEKAAPLMAAFGDALEDHDCETWLYGGPPCVCACHPQLVRGRR